jgi:hypothetical protein
VVEVSVRNVNESSPNAGFVIAERILHTARKTGGRLVRRAQKQKHVLKCCLTESVIFRKKKSSYEYCYAESAILMVVFSVCAAMTEMVRWLIKKIDVVMHKPSMVQQTGNR